MYDASAAAPTKPFPLALVVGFSLLATIAILLVMNGAMLLPVNAVLPYLGAVLGTIAAISFAVYVNRMTIDTFLMIALAGFMGFGLVQLSTQLRGDHEIEQTSYDWIARTLRNRPELKPLIADARADRVITNDEKARFDADIEAFDRAQVLAD
jgi:hypothetical protein